MNWQVDLVRKWQLATGSKEISTPLVANWAIQNGHYKPDPIDEIARLSSKLSRALRGTYFIDPQGRRVRMMHAVSSRRGQTRMPFWFDLRSAPREKMLQSLQQRREQNLADNLQLKQDQDSFNQNYNQEEPIQLVFDYSKDLLEAELLRKKSA